MGSTKNFYKRGKQGKFKVGNVLYFKSPSKDKSRTYHYKQTLRKNNQATKVIQITKEKYERAKKREV